MDQKQHFTAIEQRSKSYSLWVSVFTLVFKPFYYNLSAGEAACLLSHCRTEVLKPFLPLFALGSWISCRKYNTVYLSQIGDLGKSGLHSLAPTSLIKNMTTIPVFPPLKSMHRNRVKSNAALADGFLMGGIRVGSLP